MVRRAEPVPDTSAEELAKAAATVARTGKPRVVHAGRKVLEIVRRDTVQDASSAQARKRTGRGRPLTMDDPLWSIVGIAVGIEESDVSGNVEKYLSQAYEDDLKRRTLHSKRDDFIPA